MRVGKVAGVGMTGYRSLWEGRNDLFACPCYSPALCICLCRTCLYHPCHTFPSYLYHNDRLYHTYLHDRFYPPYRFFHIDRTSRTYRSFPPSHSDRVFHTSKVSIAFPAYQTVLAFHGDRCSFEGSSHRRVS